MREQNAKDKKCYNSKYYSKEDKPADEDQAPATVDNKEYKKDKLAQGDYQEFQRKYGPDAENAWLIAGRAENDQPAASHNQQPPSVSQTEPQPDSSISPPAASSSAAAAAAKKPIAAPTIIDGVINLTLLHDQKHLPASSDHEHDCMSEFSGDSRYQHLRSPEMSAACSTILDEYGSQCPADSSEGSSDDSDEDDSAQDDYAEDAAIQSQEDHQGARSQSSSAQPNRPDESPVRSDGGAENDLFALLGSESEDEHVQKKRIDFETITYHHYHNPAVVLRVNRCEKEMWGIVEDCTSAVEFLQDHVCSNSKCFLPAHWEVRVVDASAAQGPGPDGNPRNYEPVMVDVVDEAYREAAECIRDRFLGDFQQAKFYEYNRWLLQNTSERPSLPPKLPSAWVRKPLGLRMNNLPTNLTNSIIGPMYRFPADPDCWEELKPIECQGGNHWECYVAAQAQAVEFYKSHIQDFDFRRRCQIRESDVLQPNYDERAIAADKARHPHHNAPNRSPLVNVLYYKESKFIKYDRTSKRNGHVRLINKYLDIFDAEMREGWDSKEVDDWFRNEEFMANRHCCLQWVSCGEVRKNVDGFRVIIQGIDGILRQVKFPFKDYGNVGDRARQAAEIVARKCSPILQEQHPMFIPGYLREDQGLPQPYEEQILPDYLSSRDLSCRFKKYSAIRVKANPGNGELSSAAGKPGRIASTTATTVTVVIKKGYPLAPVQETVLMERKENSDAAFFDQSFELVQTGFWHEMNAGRFITDRMKFLWRGIKNKRDRLHCELRVLMEQFHFSAWLQNVETNNPMQIAKYFQQVKKLVTVPLQAHTHFNCPPVCDCPIEYRRPHPTALVMHEHFARQATWQTWYRRFEDYWERKVHKQFADMPDREMAILMDTTGRNFARKALKRRFQEYLEKICSDLNLPAPSFYCDWLRLEQEDVPQPEMLTGGEMMRHQKKGLSWLVSLRKANLNGLLADEMGLGKTIQTTAFLAHIIEATARRCMFLIIVPLSTLPNWQMELGKWVPAFKDLVHVHHGNAAKRRNTPRIVEARLKDEKSVIILTTYEMVIKDQKQRPLRKLVKSAGPFDCLVVDEGHRLKNHQTRLNDEISFLCATQKLLLTGTPLQNSIPELFSLMNTLLPTAFDSCEVFVKLFAAARACSITQQQDPEAVSYIHHVLRPFILRRTKAILQNKLPKKQQYVIPVRASPFQEAMYERITATRKKVVLTKDGSVKVEGVNNTLSELRKVCNHPDMVSGTYGAVEDLFGKSAKFDLCYSMIYKLRCTGHKILVFSTMTTFLELASAALSAYGLPYFLLAGNVDMHRRRLMIEQFNTDDAVGIFLISTRAGGVGLNLQAADTVIFYDCDWNPQVDLQAEDRCHRLGQDKEVKVFSFLTIDTVEEKLFATRKCKLGLDRAIIQAATFDHATGSQDRDRILKKALEDDGDLSMDVEPVTMGEVNAMLSRCQVETEKFEDLDRAAQKPQRPLLQAVEFPQWLTDWIDGKFDDPKVEEEVPEVRVGKFDGSYKPFWELQSSSDEDDLSSESSDSSF